MQLINETNSEAIRQSRLGLFTG